MMKMKALCLVLMSMLVSCQAKESGEYTLETSAKDKTVAGKDENKDGVRDDVEAELKKQYTGKVLDAALKYARANQDFITVDHNNEKDLDRVTNELSRRVDCFFILGIENDKIDRIMSKVDSYTTNNDLRMDAYIKSNDAASGGAYDLLSAEEAKCEED